MTNPPNHLLRVWRFVRWFDQARWRAASGMVPGPVFQALGPEQKVLTHWLCYITDQQRPYQQVWDEGGPIFSEVVAAYTEKREPPLRLLERFTDRDKASGGVDRFLAKAQRHAGERLSFTPRFGMHLFSIASTLAGLEKYGRSLVKYVGDHWLFCTSKNLPGSVVHRLAFLLYLLSYREIRTKLTSMRRAEFVRAVEARRKRQEKVLEDKEALQEEYEYWFAHDQRYHKRLWASLRDYVKPGSPFRDWFLEALEAGGRADISKFLRSQEGEVLGGLEVPGDIWNLRFFERVFGADVDPASFRQWYEALVKDRNIPADTYPEQFDMSFDYSPGMCEERSFATCIFRRESRIRELCLPLNGVTWKGKLCPVAAYLCSYEYPCDPEGCPVREEEPADLCRGCMLTITSSRA